MGAMAALAADRQGKFWAFHDRLFRENGRLNSRNIQEIGRDVALEMETFNRDLKDPEIREKIHEDMRDAARAGVRGVPTIFINGKRLRNRTLAGFQTVIEKELERCSKESAERAP